MRDIPTARLRLAADESMLREPAGTLASMRGLLVALRPRQWTKNGLLLAALAFTANVHRPELLTRSLIAVGLFCMLSSAGYLVNDVLDVDADRQHPTEKRRPIPAGLVPIPVALLLAVVLAVVALSG